MVLNENILKFQTKIYQISNHLKKLKHNNFNLKTWYISNNYIKHWIENIFEILNNKLLNNYSLINKSDLKKISIEI